MTGEELNQVIKTFNDYLDRMHLALQHFCEDLQDSNYREISPAAPAIVDGFEWIHEASKGLASLGEIEKEQYNSFQELMGEILDAMENKDYILLHDVLEFDLMPSLAALKVNPKMN